MALCLAVWTDATILSQRLCGLTLGKVFVWASVEFSFAFGFILDQIMTAGITCDKISTHFDFLSRKVESVSRDEKGL